MTLEEFCKKRNVSPTHPTTEKGAVSLTIDHPTPELYNLSDYVVSTVSGDVVWLVPRKVTVSTKIAWRMIDGNVMAGNVIFIGYDTFMVKRVDGGECCVPKKECWIATNKDVEDACEFFKKLGTC